MVDNNISITVNLTLQEKKQKSEINKIDAFGTYLSMPGRIKQLLFNLIKIYFAYF